MSHNILADPTLHEFLYRLDHALAEGARGKGCPYCGGIVHSANYFRLPRGGLGRRALRFSFCCAREGCRKRLTPCSMRFLARRVYVGMVVVLVSALRYGVTPYRLERLSEVFGMSERTLVRWRRWWQRDFVTSGFWQGLRGLLRRPVATGRLPASLVELFEGDERSRLLATLRLLVPITGGKGLAGQGI